MASFVDGGTMAFDQLMYAPQSRVNLEFLKERSQQVTQSLTETGKRFFEAASNTWEQMYGEGAARMARAAVRGVQSLWSSNTIRELITIGQMQNAPLVMQRGIMANPEIRQMYLDQKVDGYSDTYVNKHANAIGMDHYDYRRVMNGIVQDKEDGGWVSYTFFEELEDPDDELYFDQQVAMLDTWGNVIRVIRKGKDDPLSRFNSSL